MLPSLMAGVNQVIVGDPARELQRTVRRLITLPLADWIISNPKIGHEKNNILNVSYDVDNHRASFDLEKGR